MKNAMQQALRSSGLRTITLPLHRVWDGSKCRHTGLRLGRKGKHIPTGFPQDKGLEFIKTCASHQKDMDGNDIILGLSDIVEVLE